MILSEVYTVQGISDIFNSILKFIYPCKVKNVFFFFATTDKIKSS